MSARKFLTRQQATYALGLMDASQRKEPLGVRVACRDKLSGDVFEAIDDECLHAQIALRVRGVLEDGWTVPGDPAPVNEVARVVHLQALEDRSYFVFTTSGPQPITNELRRWMDVADILFNFDTVRALPRPRPFSEDPERDDVYRCHVCGNDEQFTGIDCNGYGGEGSCGSFDCMLGDGDEICDCTTTLVQPFDCVDGNAVSYDSFDGNDGAEIGTFTKIICRRCDTVIYQSPEHVEVTSE